MPLLMTQAEFADRHGVGKPAVSGWKKKGLLVFAPDPERPAKMLVDAEKSDLLVRGSIDPTRGRPRSSEHGAETPAAEAPVRQLPPLSGIEAARLEEMQERTRRRKIETEQLLGSLVSAAEAERRAGELGRKCREGVMAAIRQQSERIAAESDPRQVVAILSEAVEQLFNRLADEIEAEARAEREVDRQLAPLAGDDEGDEP